MNREPISEIGIEKAKVEGFYMYIVGRNKRRLRKDPKPLNK